MEQEIDRLLRLPEVLQIVGRSKANWYKKIKDGEAPAPIVSHHRFAAWRLSDIKAYLEVLYARSDAKQTA
jgi:predicted DNA-binding transcriptional regulator AlpA